jgi:hypothetical protein
MKSLCSILLSFVLGTQMFWIVPANAGTIEYHGLAKYAGGSLTGDARVTRVGKLQGSGVASIHENKIDIILGTTDLTQKIPPALTGDTFNTKTSTVNHKTKLTGLVFFHDGTSIDKLTVSHIPDTVKTVDGKTITGRITDVSDEHVSITTDDGRQTVSTDRIREIKSERIYEFTLPLSSKQALDARADFKADTTKIDFSSTMTSAIAISTKTSEKESKPERHCNKLKLALIIVITGALVATAIAVPIAVAVGTHHHSNNSQNQLAEAMFLVNAEKAKAAANAAAAAPAAVKAVAPIARFVDLRP